MKAILLRKPWPSICNRLQQSVTEKNRWLLSNAEALQLLNFTSRNVIVCHFSLIYTTSNTETAVKFHSFLTDANISGSKRKAEIHSYRAQFLQSYMFHQMWNFSSSKRRCSVYSATFTLLPLSSVSSSCEMANTSTNLLIK